ncbi:rRNA biogenesis protein RRP5-like [Epargyreus clarus]|uniref:rRNA biogenesis protein RRP5-like n=1 Tax=Epargyreus clarus TaxID=520877 RepID=UPI003C2BE8FC
MVDAEDYFPRGGKKPTTKFFKQSTNFLGGHEKAEKRKKKPKKKSDEDDGYLSDEATKDIDQSYKNCGVWLKYSVIKEGFLLLGRVRQVQDTRVYVSLPCRLSGVVMACHISEAYNKMLEAYVNDQTDKVKDLQQMFRPGQYVALKVLEVAANHLMLSMMPQHINSGKMHADLHKGALLQAAVSSVEDHGYVMDIGIPNVRTFLPKNAANPEIELDTGMLTWCSIKSIAPSPDSSVITLTSELPALQRAFQKKSSNTLLPANAVDFTVDKPLDNGIEGHIFDDKIAYIQRQHVDKVNGKKPALGQRVRARVLYVLPTTNTPFLTMRNIFETTYPDMDEEQKLQEGDIVDDAQVIKIVGRVVYLRLGDRGTGLLSLRRLQVDEDLEDRDVVAKSYPIGSTHRVRVLRYNLCDFSYSVTDEREVLQQRYFSLAQLAAGDIVDATVATVADSHVILQVGRVTGYVPQAHLTDAGIFIDPKKASTSKLPKKKFKVGQEVKARVLAVEPGKRSLFLTLKPSLLAPDLAPLKSYEEAEVGKSYTGVIAHIKDYVVVSFFNNVHAYVPRHLVTSQRLDSLASAFHVGQIVNCTIMRVDPEKKKMSGSLTTAPFTPTEKPMKSKKRKTTNDDTESPYKKQKSDSDNKESETDISKKKKKKHDEQESKSADLKESKKKELENESQEIEKDSTEENNVEATEEPTKKRKKKKKHEKEQDESIENEATNEENNTEVTEEPTKKRKKKKKQEKEQDESIENSATHEGSNTEVVEEPTKKRKKKKKQEKEQDESIENSATHEGSNTEVVEEPTKKRKKKNKVEQEQEEEPMENSLTNEEDNESSKQKKKKKKEKETEVEQPITEESDAIETDFYEDSDHVLTPQDLGLIDMSDCQTAKQYKKRVVSLLKAIQARSKRMDTINEKIVSLEAKGLNFKNKKYHTAMHMEKLVIEERAKKLLAALLVAQDKLRELGLEKNKDYKKKNKNKDNDVGLENKDLEATKDKSSKVKKINKDEDVLKSKLSEIKVVDELKPVFEVPSAKDFWSAPTESLAKTAQEESSSSDEEEEEKPKKKRKKLTAAEKVSKAREEEERLRMLEQQAAASEGQPRAAEQFERQLLARPAASQLWIAYMAFHLQATEIEKARAVARKALNTISFREENERLNVWIALLNLEHRFGTKESQQKTLEEALQMNEPYEVHSKLLDIYVETGQAHELAALAELMLRRYRRRADMFPRVGAACYRAGLLDKARQVMQKGIDALEKKEHVSLLVQFARLEREAGERERAEALLERLLATYPQRVDVCAVYVDMLVKAGDVEQARQVMERMTSQKLPARKMKILYKKWIEVEEKIGDKDRVESVRQRATEFIEKAKF